MKQILLFFVFCFSISVVNAQYYELPKWSDNLPYKPLIQPISNPISRMATICAILHHKHAHFFWTGFYILLSLEGELEVGPYQGPLTCLRLKKDAVVVSDVHDFDGHIACNPLSKSKIVLPLLKNDKIVDVLDVDSDKKSSFDSIDAKYLAQIIELVYIK